MQAEKSYKSSRVLVVDDIASTREVVRDMLQEIGFKEIRLARDGHEALRILQEAPTDLIICDHVMEGMSGLDLLTELRDRPLMRDIAVIMMSSATAAPVISCALDLGVDDYLPKPISLSVLRSKIDDVYRRRFATV